MDEELEKLANDLYRDLMSESTKNIKGGASKKSPTSKKSNSTKKTASSNKSASSKKSNVSKKGNTQREDSLFSSDVNDFVESLRNDGFDVPDNWEDLVDQMEYEMDMLYGNDFADTDPHRYMDLDISEELYPDLYEFEFEFMPALAETDWIDASSRNAILGDKEQLLTLASERDIEIDPKDFKVSREHREGLEVYFYEFPKPPRSPFALYGAIVFGRRGGRYFTLELDSSGGYMGCAQTVVTHYNFGTVENTSKDNFVKAAVALYKANAVHL